MQSQTILWENRETPSIEYFNLSTRADGQVLEGTIILMLEGLPARVTYRVECDLHWRTRKVFVHQDQAGTIKRLTLTVDDAQNWSNQGVSVPFATGLSDIDLEIAPSTNSLPLNRQPIKVGETRVVDALWVRFPSLTLEKLHQRYTRLEPNLYHYEAPEIDFETNIEVDDASLVVDYRGLWRRVSMA